MDGFFSAQFFKVFPFLILFIAFGIQQGDGQPERKAFDKSLYRLMLEQVTPNGLLENRTYSVQVRVDPRPVKGTPTYVRNLSFAQFDETELDQYIQRIEELGAIPADIEEDNVCLGTGGLPPPPRPGEVYEKREIPEHCKEIRSSVTIVFALPRTEKAILTDEKDDEVKRQRYVIRVIEMSSYTHGVFDLIYERQEDNQWKFIKKLQRSLWMS